MRPRVVLLACLALLTSALAAVAPASPAQAALGFRVDVVATGLDHPWEVRQLPGGRLLVTQRNRARLTLVNPANGTKRNVAFPSRRIWVRGETGLLGLEVDPAFRNNRRIYTCSGWKKSRGRHDVRVIAWTLNRDLTRARKAKVLRPGLPTASTGQHGGCRLLIARNGALLIGTGDGKAGWKPQSLRSFGGKVLRINRFTGKPAKANRWYDRRGVRRYVLSYGHRNVQGLAQRPDGSLWSVEHGTHRDDEVNKLRNGGNYGWHPVPGYDESVPMTNHRLAGKQQNARWRSGNPTIAPSGAAFVTGAKWRGYRNTLAVAVLKGQRLMFVNLNRAGRKVWVRSPAALRGHGRLRSVHSAGNSLFVTTDNGDGRDVVLRVRPRS